LIPWALTQCRKVKNFWRYNFLLLFILLCSTGTSLLQPILISDIIDKGILNSNLTLIWINGLLATLTVFISIILHLMVEKIAANFRQAIGSHLRELILKKAESIPGSIINKYEKGKFFSLLYEDIEMFENLHSNVFVPAIINVLSIFVVIGLMLSINYTLVLLCIFIFLLFFLVQKLMSKVISNKVSEYRKTLDVFWGILQERIHYFHNQLLSGLNILFWIDYKKSEDTYYNKNISMKVYSSLFSDIMMTANALVNILVYSLGGYFIVKGSLTMGMLTAFSMYVSRLMSPLNNLSIYAMEYQNAKVSLIRLKDFLGEDEMTIMTPTSRSILNGDITLENVGFSYNNEHALQNVSLKFEKNCITAVVGKSGSGKSTIINLLFRLWDTQSGVIKINGNDIRQFSLDELRNTYSIIGQEIYLMNTSLRHNLTLGANIDDSVIYNILEKLELKDVVMELPDKLETIIGTSSVRFSGGQNQRIAMARTLLSKKEIVIFDEATSALDIITEQLVFENIRPMLKGKTVIIITHHIHAITNADYIYCLNNGQVIEQGTHEQLILNNGEYTKQYNATDNS